MSKKHKRERNSKELRKLRRECLKAASPMELIVIVEELNEQFATKFDENSKINEGMEYLIFPFEFRADTLTDYQVWFFDHLVIWTSEEDFRDDPKTQTVREYLMDQANRFAKNMRFTSRLC